MSNSPTKRADTRTVVEKLRMLVSHPATEEPLRAVARNRLDLLAPRHSNPLPGSPRRRASDRSVVPVNGLGHLVHAAYETAGRGTALQPGLCGGPGHLDLLI